MRVAYRSDVEKKDLDNLTSKLDDKIEVIQISLSDDEKLMENPEQLDAIITARVPREFLEKASNLKYYIIPFAGVPKQDKETLPDFPGLTVINSHFNSWFVAEHAITLLLASVKRLCPIHNKMKGGDWTPRYEHQWGWTLRDKTLLILGYGEIGKNISKIAKSFQMKVMAIKKTLDENFTISRIGTNEDLPEMLPKADFIICTLPLTEDTKGYLGSKEFDLMKDDVHIVNVGRGPVIDEEALYNALKEDKIGGAAIDTWWIYPPSEEARSDTFPSNYPLDEFENVIFSPHRSSHVREREDYRMKDLARILNSLEKGDIINEVDINQGY